MDILTRMSLLSSIIIFSMYITTTFIHVMLVALSMMLRIIIVLLVILGVILDISSPFIFIGISISNQLIKI